ncbi:MAG: LysM peptidoglycan-binding domain-containing protein [Planctomycetaceae bacterium]
MATEARMGMAVVVILVCAFAFLVYHKFDLKQQALKAAAIAAQNSEPGTSLATDDSGHIESSDPQADTSFGYDFPSAVATAAERSQTGDQSPAFADAEPQVAAARQTPTPVSKTDEFAVLTHTSDRQVRSFGEEAVSETAPAKEPAFTLSEPEVPANSAPAPKESPGFAAFDQAFSDKPADANKPALTQQQPDQFEDFPAASASASLAQADRAQEQWPFEEPAKTTQPIPKFDGREIDNPGSENPFAATSKPEGLFPKKEVAGGEIAAADAPQAELLPPVEAFTAPFETPEVEVASAGENPPETRTDDLLSAFGEPQAKPVESAAPAPAAIVQFDDRPFGDFDDKGSAPEKHAAAASEPSPFESTPFPEFADRERTPASAVPDAQPAEILPGDDFGSPVSGRSNRMKRPENTVAMSAPVPDVDAFEDSFPPPAAAARRPAPPREPEPSPYRLSVPTTTLDQSERIIGTEQPVRSVARSHVIQPVAMSGDVDVVDVQPDDTYWTISKRVYGTARYFSGLALYNQHRIPDPKKLRTGMKVLIPAPDVLESQYPELYTDLARSQASLPRGFFLQPNGSPAYRIGERETLSEISQKHLGRASRWIEIQRANPVALRDPNRLKPGTVITLPDDATDVHMIP